MIPTYMELSTDRQYEHYCLQCSLHTYVHTNKPAGKPFIGLLARDSSRETPCETPCKRLLARDSSRETSWGGRRTQQPTIDGSGEGDGKYSGWRRLMAMAQRVMARWDTITTTMATGDDNDNDGDSSAGNKVDDDGNDNDYGNGR